MKTFKEFIMEASNRYNWNGYRAVATYMDVRRRDEYLKAIDRFEAALNGTEDLFNADFKEMYSYAISRNLDKAWNTMYDKVETVKGMENSIYARSNGDLGSSSIAITSIKKSLRVAKQINAPLEMIQFLQNLETMSDMVKELKKVVKSGRKPNVAKEAAKQQFQAMVTQDAAVKMVSLLNTAADNIRREYEKSMTSIYISQVKYVWENREKYKKIMLQKNRGIRRLYNWLPYASGDLILLQRITTQEKIGFDEYELVLVPGWEKITETYAKDIVKQILDGFVAKNTQKLAAIVAHKGNLKEGTIKSNRINQGVLENTMYFEFTDGARFTVYTQTVYKISSRGKPFLQFPTRFTNVVNSDGKRMSAPNEEKMNKEFH